MPVSLQEKVTNSQSLDSSPCNGSPSSELAEMQQGLQKSNAALEAAQSHLSARQEEVLELNQRLEAAQAEIASLQVLANPHSPRSGCLQLLFYCYVD